MLSVCSAGVREASSTHQWALLWMAPGPWRAETHSHPSSVFFQLAVCSECDTPPVAMVTIREASAGCSRTLDPGSWVLSQTCSTRPPPAGFPASPPLSPLVGMLVFSTGPASVLVSGSFTSRDQQLSGRPPVAAGGCFSTWSVRRGPVLVPVAACSHVTLLFCCFGSFRNKVSFSAVCAHPSELVKDDVYDLSSWEQHCHLEDCHLAGLG